MKRAISIILLFVAGSNNSFAQSGSSTIWEALNNPKEVVNLDLSGVEVPMEDLKLSQFVNLEKLSLKNLHLTALPPGLGALPKLSYLDLSGNDMVELPESLANARSLTELHLDDELKLDFPQAIKVISDLPNLKVLTLRHDSLTKIPSGVLSMDRLEELDIGDNLIRQLPMEFEQMRSLKRLFLDAEPNLNFEQAFGVIGQMSSLEELHLENNSIQEIPEKILKMKNLRMLFLDGVVITNDSDLEPSHMRLDHEYNSLTLNSPQLQETLQRTGLRIKF